MHKQINQRETEQASCYTNSKIKSVFCQEIYEQNIQRELSLVLKYLSVYGAKISIFSFQSSPEKTKNMCETIHVKIWGNEKWLAWLMYNTLWLLYNMCTNMVYIAAAAVFIAWLFMVPSPIWGISSQHQHTHHVTSLCAFTHIAYLIYKVWKFYLLYRHNFWHRSAVHILILMLQSCLCLLRLVVYVVCVCVCMFAKLRTIWDRENYMCRHQRRRKKRQQCIEIPLTWNQGERKPHSSSSHHESHTMADLHYIVSSI